MQINDAFSQQVIIFSKNEVAVSAENDYPSSGEIRRTQTGVHFETEFRV